MGIIIFTNEYWEMILKGIRYIDKEKNLNSDLSGQLNSVEYQHLNVDRTWQSFPLNWIYFSNDNGPRNVFLGDGDRDRFFLNDLELSFEFGAYRYISSLSFNPFIRDNSIVPK